MPSSNPSTPPVLPTYGSSEGMIPVSGIDPSGTEGYFPGPHFVETQTLNIKYMRIPETGEHYPLSYTLSATPATYTTLGSIILPIIEARYSVVKDMNTYSTSGYQQNQKFAVIPKTTDPYGNSYDSTSGLGASAIGPMGEVCTQYPWYYRRPWKPFPDGDDHEVERYMIGSSWFMRSMRGPEGSSEADCEKGWGIGSYIDTPADFVAVQDWTRKRFSRTFNAIMWRDGYGTSFPNLFWWEQGLDSGMSTFFAGPTNYPMFGKYNPDDESPALIQNWVDNIGREISRREQINGVLHKVLYGLGDNFKTTKDGGPCFIRAFPNTGIFEYSVLRHDWS